MSEKALNLGIYGLAVCPACLLAQAQEPVIAVNESEENACVDWQNESDYATNEGARAKGEDGNGAGGPVESGNGSEGELIEVESVFSSDEDDVADEEVTPGRKGVGEVSIAKRYSQILEDRISSLENEQPMDEENVSV